jgi:hypothetical protein
MEALAVEFSWRCRWRDARYRDPKILNERGEEVLPTPPLPLVTRLICLVMELVLDQRFRGSA